MTKNYVVDYLSIANRDIFVTEAGSFTQRYVYDASGTRLSAEFDYADVTARGAKNEHGEFGENFRSDFAMDTDGAIIAHAIYDPWGSPVPETYVDSNFSGIDNLTNFTGYTWDEVLGMYFAQNRFYDAETHRFTQEDPVKDGTNWYVYCGNEPTLHVDPWGLYKAWGDIIAKYNTNVTNSNKILLAAPTEVTGKRKVIDILNMLDYEYKDEPVPELGFNYETWTVLREPRDWTLLER